MSCTRVCNKNGRVICFILPTEFLPLKFHRTVVIQESFFPKLSSLKCYFSLLYNFPQHFFLSIQNLVYVSFGMLIFSTILFLHFAFVSDQGRVLFPPKTILYSSLGLSYLCPHAAVQKSCASNKFGPCEDKEKLFDLT